MMGRDREALGRLRFGDRAFGDCRRVSKTGAGEKGLEKRSRLSALLSPVPKCEGPGAPGMDGC